MGGVFYGGFTTLPILRDSGGEHKRARWHNIGVVSNSLATNGLRVNVCRDMLVCSLAGNFSTAKEGSRLRKSNAWQPALRAASVFHGYMRWPFRGRCLGRNHREHGKLDQRDCSFVDQHDVGSSEVLLSRGEWRTNLMRGAMPILRHRNVREDAIRSLPNGRLQPSHLAYSGSRWARVVGPIQRAWAGDSFGWAARYGMRTRC